MAVIFWRGDGWTSWADLPLAAGTVLPTWGGPAHSGPWLAFQRRPWLPGVAETQGNMGSKLPWKWQGVRGSGGASLGHSLVLPLQGSSSVTRKRGWTASGAWDGGGGKDIENHMVGDSSPRIASQSLHLMAVKVCVIYSASLYPSPCICDSLYPISYTDLNRRSWRENKHIEAT